MNQVYCSYNFNLEHGLHLLQNIQMRVYDFVNKLNMSCYLPTIIVYHSSIPLLPNYKDWHL